MGSIKKQRARAATAAPDRRRPHPPARHESPGNRSRDLIALGIVVLLGIVIYSNSFDCAFQFDDFHNIVNNNAIRNISDVSAWWHFYPTRPVGIFTFVLNYHFSQLGVWSYHLVNLIIHLVNACLIWWLTLLILSSPAMEDQPIAAHKRVLAFVTALLFVSHPLATQSVTYIVQRMASLAALFYFLSLALYVKARMSSDSRRRYVFFAGSLASAVLALLTKENAFTLPFAILLFEVCFLQKRLSSIRLRDYRVLIVALVAAIIFVPLKLSSSVFKPTPPSLGNVYTTTVQNFLFTEFSVILKYIQLLFMPIRQNLDYDFPISNSLFEVRTLLSVLVLLALVAWAVVSFKKHRLLAFGVAWFFLTLSIEASIVPLLDVVFEHRTYLPSFGFCLILAAGVQTLLWKRYRSAAIAVFVVIIGSNSVLAHERNNVWKTELSLWSDAIEKSPNKARPFVNRCKAYGLLGQWDKAVTDCSRAIEINPLYYDAGYFNRGLAYSKMGQWASAVADYTKAIEITPNYVDAYTSRAAAYEGLRQFDLQIADCTKAIALDPMQAKAYSNRGNAYWSLGHLDTAITDYTKAIAVDPSLAEAYSNRGTALGSLGRWDEALADYSRAIERAPGYAAAYVNRGVAHSRLGQWREAVADYSKALEIDPAVPNARAYRDAAYQKLGITGK